MLLQYLDRSMLGLALLSASAAAFSFPPPVCKSNVAILLREQRRTGWRSSERYIGSGEDEAIDVPDIQMTEEEKAFFAATKEKCAELNLPLETVKNARDLASVTNSPILPNRVFRMGRISDASADDCKLLLNDINIKTLVDLRSPTELKDDPTLEREEVFNGFVSLVWTERGKDGCVRELDPGEPRIKRRNRRKEVVAGLKAGMSAATTDDPTELEEEDDEDCDDCLSLSELLKKRESRKERHFVSLMNEFKYVKGTLSKLRKRDIARVLLKSPGAIFSKRIRTGVKDVFLDEINDGGLPMLNDLLLRFGAPGIKYTLELCADRSRHPIGFYCTAGKDRTGMIAAIILAMLGVPDENIVEDYSLSANVYAEMNDHKAMVGALSQRNLDPKTFLGAPPQVMRETLKNIRDTYGSIEGYLDWIGFGPESREKLKAALLLE